MNPRTVSARDLETMAHAAHERVELPGPEGGWATAVINGHRYRARVAPAAVAETTRCLITCITTDDEGRGYYCESCPELRKATP